MLTDDDIRRIRLLESDGIDRTAKIVADLAREISLHAKLEHPSDLFAPSKKARIVGLRHVLMYRAHQMGCSIRSIAAALHCDWTTVRHGIEKERGARA